MIRNSGYGWENQDPDLEVQTQGTEEIVISIPEVGETQAGTNTEVEVEIGIMRDTEGIQVEIGMKEVGEEIEAGVLIIETAAMIGVEDAARSEVEDGAGTEVEAGV